MQTDRPNIIIMPPLGFFAALAISIALGAWVPLGLLPAYPWTLGMILGLPLLAGALFINVSGFRAFRRAKTNVNPYKPALTVVRGGVFRLTRNPMYLGMVLFVVGLGLTLSNTWSLIAAALLWALFHWGVVLREEQYMEAKFGAPYRDLLAETRRWL